MSKVIQRRHGTSAQHKGFTGAFAEITVDSDENILVLHDGTKLGGFPHLRIYDNAGFRNSIFRGKNLGNTPDWANIANGTFKDMFIGDYWTKGDRIARIAGFNYFLNNGDTALTVPHVTVVYDTPFYNHVMNDSNTTTGGYLGSKMYAEGLEQAKSIIKADFAGHVVKHRQYFSNAIDANGRVNAGAWVDSEIDLMNEVMVYGSVVDGQVDGAGVRNIGIGKSQLPLFALRPDLIHNRITHIWLRDICSATSFASVTSNGVAASNYASGSRGVRPAFSIS